jgi:hypothetical protein
MNGKTKMAENIYSYTVRCKTCRSQFKVKLFESHEKNLFLADKKDWYCEKCKKGYFNEQTTKLTNEQQAIGFPELDGSDKMISWAVKIRGELINKVVYLKKSLRFENDDEKTLSDQGFNLLFLEWGQETGAKWWIDHRKMTVRDISRRLAEITASIKNGK